MVFQRIPSERYFGGMISKKSFEQHNLQDHFQLEAKRPPKFTYKRIALRLVCLQAYGILL